LGELLGKSLSDNELTKIAKETGCIQRQRKISARSLLDSLIFSGINNYASLNQIAHDHHVQYDILISKQAIDKRFTEKTEAFLANVLSCLIKDQLQVCVWDIKAFGVNKLKIKDSTKFNIPDRMKNMYPGTGGAGSGATIGLQVEIDLLNGHLGGLSLNSGLYSDQKESKSDLEQIEQGCLYIRDLGYISHRYMRKLKEENSFFINRLPTRSEIYVKRKGLLIKLDMKALYRMLKRRGTSIDLEVLIGKDQVPARLIGKLVPEDVRIDRLKKKECYNQKYKCKTSEDFIDRAGMNLMVTNFSSEQVSSEKILEVYHLRWQIELLFKAWKSMLKIHEVKDCKSQRLMCQLYCKLILAVLSWSFYSSLKTQINASLQKVYKHVVDTSQLIRNYIFKGCIRWLLIIEEIPLNILINEQKKGKIRTSKII